MTKKILHVAIIMGVVLSLFVFFPDVLVPEVPQIPDPPSALAEFARLQLPHGFTANIYASDLPGVRVLERDPSGRIIASLMKEGKVVVLFDADDDGEVDEITTLIQDLKNPHGITLVCEQGSVSGCFLYVAETERLSVYAYDPLVLSATFIKRVAELPASGFHITRTIIKDPSADRLLISIGSSCEFCQELDRRYASIQSLDMISGELTTYAKGLYNTVFMAIEPVTGDVWGTEMARGSSKSDSAPPDEINIIKKGRDYGWPFCYGNNVSVEDLQLEEGSFGESCSTASKTPALIDLPIHSGPLGLAFIPSEGWPQEYANDLLVVYHGPGSDAQGDGYRIMRIEMGVDGLPSGTARPFMTGFEDASGELFGRPVALFPQTDGTLLISEDLFGRIYRVAWRGDR